MLKLDNKMLWDGLVSHITANTVRAELEAWGGEVGITVQIHVGAYGHFSAVMVMEYPDSPLKALTYTGYTEKAGSNQFLHLYNWLIDSIADVLAGALHGTGDLALVMVEDVDYTMNKFTTVTY